MSTADQATPKNGNGALRVEIHTGAYIIFAVVQTRHQRLIDVLENLTSPYLQVENAEVQPLRNGKGRNGFQSAGTLMIRCRDIRMALPYENGSELETGRLHPQYVPKYPVPARLFMDSMEIEGNIYVREGEDALTATQNMSVPFIAVTHANVRYLDETLSSPFAASIAVVNRDFVNLIALRQAQPNPSNSRLEQLLAQSSHLGERLARKAK